jgi:hypothetical protein
MASTTPARTRQTTAARKRPASKPTGPAAALDFEPIHIEADEDVVEERVPLFYIGDTEYTIPKEIPVGVGLEYLRIAAEIGQELAAPALLTRVLGTEAYKALEKSRGLKGEQLERIIQIVIDLALGRGEKKEGKA